MNPALWLPPLILCVASLSAQDGVPSAPAEPLLPTTSKECSDFSHQYQTSVVDKLMTSLMDTPMSGPQVACPQSCIQGGWGCAGSITQSLFTPKDRWCRAVADRDKKFKTCMSEVEANQFKRRVAEQVFEHKKPDRPKATTDDEIDAAFKIINHKGMTQGQNKVVSQIQVQGS